MTAEKINNLKTRVGTFLACSFVLAFLFTQSTSLLHVHASDLKKHVDCELCLKQNSGDDALVAMHLTPEFSATAERIASSPASATIFRPIAAKSRSPPLFV
jgi:hypothetical protein